MTERAIKQFHECHNEQLADLARIKVLQLLQKPDAVEWEGRITAPCGACIELKITKRS